MADVQVNWAQAVAIPPRTYTCGHCGNVVGPNLGYEARSPSTNAVEATICICSYCMEPTYFMGGKQVPGAPFGNEVPGLPEDVATLYAEARNSFTVNAYTASVLTCRKILMNLAVSKGGKENQTFVKYVNYLAEAGYVPPDGKGWVDHIRQRGNEANHEIRLMTRGDAEELISFVEMLLKFIYEFPARVPSAAPTTAVPAGEPETA